MNTQSPALADTKVPSLYSILADVPDFRKARGIRYPFAAILRLILAASLCGARSPSAIADWAANHAASWLRPLGFTRPAPPSRSTIARVLAAVDINLLEAKLASWANAVLPSAQLSAGQPLAPLPVAVDGKSLRGSRKLGAHASHLLSALAHDSGIVLAQVAVGDKTNELKAFRELLKLLPVQGKLITADAMFTQQEVAAQIIQQGGDYLLVVKDNQPLLHEDIKAVFGQPQELGLTKQERATEDSAKQVSIHGGRIEERRVRTSSAGIACYRGRGRGALWAGAAQLICIEREVIDKRSGQVKRKERAYGITSLSAERGSAAEILRVWRGHWSIENRLHWVRDVTYDEDRQSVRSGGQPQALAALRNAAISLLRLAGAKNIAAANRYYAGHPRDVLTLLGC